MIAPERLAERALELLARLIAFDTVSAKSNLALIDWVEDYLRAYGVEARRIASGDGIKASLVAAIGPLVEGGVVLSGHTDVVPVADQAWSSDPFVLTRRDGRLYGRGACDMKGFIALALAAVPELAAAPLAQPVILALSFDEEIGCLGAPAMIEEIGRAFPAPALAVIGEPTSMEVVSGHKSIAVWRVTVTGREAHSSQPHLGASAVMAAARLMAVLVETADRLEAMADPASPFEPKGATLTIGQVEGGTAPVILARHCSFQFDLRAPAGFDAAAELARFFAIAAQLDAELKARAPDGGVLIEALADVPPLVADPRGEAGRFVRGLAGDNGPDRVVSYASEAGQFQRAGIPSVLCGPGSIDQAHQRDEYVEIAQIERGAAFMVRLIEALSRA
jgi:acetylornithine deacetylase